MSQDPIAPLNPATTSGTDLATKLVNNEQTLLTQHSGTSRPSYAQAGTIWLDTTSDPWKWKFYDGTSDIVIARFDISTHLHQSAVDEVTVASASTTNVLGAASEFVAVSGTATITSLGSEPNQVKFVRATGAFTLTHNATSLILPTAANITAASGDTFIVISNASGNARVLAYQKASGAGLVTPTPDIASGTVMLFFQTSAPTGWTKDTSNYNDHAIRIVTGTPSSGGSLNFSSVFGKSATDAHTLTSAQMPAHTHGPGNLGGFSDDDTHDHSYTTKDTTTSRDASGGTAGLWRNTTGANTSDDTHSHYTFMSDGVTDSTGGGGSHSHNMDIRVRYVDAIRATKD